MKEMINRGGKKIAPHAVQIVLLSHPAVQDALAFAVPDPKYGEEINAALILQPGQTASARDEAPRRQVSTRIGRDRSV